MSKDYEELEAEVWSLEYILKNCILMVDNGHNTADIKGYILSRAKLGEHDLSDSSKMEPTEGETR
jgi:hypothetical protein